jgi:15-cis-phytoene synthase
VTATSGDQIDSGPEQAYATCEAITRTEARNFYYGIRLLPAPKRRALCAVYALARRIDDIGDGDLPPAQKLTALDQVRRSLHTLTAAHAGDAPWADPVIDAVRDAATRYPIPIGAFDELVDGVRLDVVGSSYRSFDDLVTYCRYVAGSVGRLCLSIFDGSGAADEPRAIELADALGVALQQTNILRDIREDLINGRVYLPQEDLERFDVELRLNDEGALDDPDGRLAELIRYRASEARGWYQRGLQLVPMLDRRSAACCAAMAGIYARLLRQIEAAPQTVYDRRLSLTGWQKARVAARALTGTSTGTSTGTAW